MFCPRCGNNNNDLNLWCTRCGCRLEDIQDNTAPVSIVETVAENEPECVENAPVTEGNACEQKSKKINDYMMWSIISAVLGSIAFGIVAVIFSGLAKTEFASGNLDKMKEYSDKAKLFCLISLAIAIVKVVFIILTLTIAVFMASMPFYMY